MRWTRKSIIAEIKRLHEAGEELYYSKAEDNHLNLVRASGWHYGTWRRAVEAAGIDYESLSRYQRWNKKKIVERIQELHAQGQSLHWRAISTHVDPPLAAAALRSNGFNSWREAIAAAGFDIDSVARYKEWDNEKVLKAIRRRKRAGLSMFSKSLQNEEQPLFCAARRRFGSWDAALNAAGLDADSIRLRKYNPALNAPRRKPGEAAKVKAAHAAASTPVVKSAAKKITVTKLPTPAQAVKNGKGSGKIMLPANKPATKVAAKKVAVKAPVKTAPIKPEPVKTASQANPKPATKNAAAKKSAVKKVAAKKPVSKGAR